MFRRYQVTPERTRSKLNEAALKRARAARNAARREHNLSPLAGEVAQDWLLQREESEGGLQPYQLRHGSIMERL